MSPETKQQHQPKRTPTTITTTFLPDVVVGQKKIKFFQRSDKFRVGYSTTVVRIHCLKDITKIIHFATVDDIHKNVRQIFGKSIHLIF